jgi:hypothetical protein
LAEPATAKNGDTLEIRVSAGEKGLSVTVDASPLDSMKREPIALMEEAGEIYTGTLTISLANAAANGGKTLKVKARDRAGKVGTTTIQIVLDNPAVTRDAAPPEENFDGTDVDSKWDGYTQDGGGVHQIEGRLVAFTGDKYPQSQGMIRSRWKFVGDFDVQVDFEIGEGWSQPEAGVLYGATLGAIIEDRFYTLSRMSMSPAEGSAEDVFMTPQRPISALSRQSPAEGGAKDVFMTYMNWGEVIGINRQIPTQATSGKLRLIRAGTSLATFYDVGAGWEEGGIMTVPASPARVYLGNLSFHAYHAFTSYFDNFIINSGLTQR